MFANLVVALDGSACADHALELALRLAKLDGSKLAICSVADPSPLYGRLDSGTVADATLEQIHRAAEDVVDAAVAKATAAKIPVAGIVLEGEPVWEITDYAKRIHADAIVIGTHGRSGIQRLLLGSVAEGVLRQAVMPVFTVREEARIAALQTKSEVEAVS